LSIFLIQIIHWLLRSIRLRLLNLLIVVRRRCSWFFLLILLLLLSTVARITSFSNQFLDIYLCLLIDLIIVNCFVLGIFHLLLVFLDHVVISLVVGLHVGNRRYSLNWATNIDTTSKDVIHIWLIRLCQVLNVWHLSNWIVLLHIWSLELRVPL
jgi:hypothetical protein